MNYGERQERAELIVKALRAQPDAIDFKGRTYAQVADEIENMTDEGRSVVAVAGLVLHALHTQRQETP